MDLQTTLSIASSIISVITGIIGVMKALERKPEKIGTVPPPTPLGTQQPIPPQAQASNPIQQPSYPAPMYTPPPYAPPAQPYYGAPYPMYYPPQYRGISPHPLRPQSKILTGNDILIAILTGIPATLIVAGGDKIFKDRLSTPILTITWLLAFLGIVSLCAVVGMIPGARSGRAASGVLAGLFFLASFSIGATIYAFVTVSAGGFTIIESPILFVVYAIVFSPSILGTWLFGFIGQSVARNRIRYGASLPYGA